MKNLLFDFAGLSVKDKAAKEAIKYFNRAGAQVVAQDVDTKIKRTNGIPNREMSLTFADSQIVVIRIKESGDIFQVLINNKVVPIKNQDDHVQAIAEIVAMLESGRTKFQKKQALAMVKVPPGIRTSAPKMEVVLDQKITALTEAIAAIDVEIALARAA